MGSEIEELKERLKTYQRCCICQHAVVVIGSKNPLIKCGGRYCLCEESEHYLQQAMNRLCGCSHHVLMEKGLDNPGHMWFE